MSRGGESKLTSTRTSLQQHSSSTTQPSSPSSSPDHRLCGRYRARLAEGEEADPAGTAWGLAGGIGPEGDHIGPEEGRTGLGEDHIGLGVGRSSNVGEGVCVSNWFSGLSYALRVCVLQVCLGTACAEET